jgi:hypothetical protein
MTIALSIGFAAQLIFNGCVLFALASHRRIQESRNDFERSTNQSIKYHTLAINSVLDVLETAK